MPTDKGRERALALIEQAATALKRGEHANWELARLTFENTFAAGDVNTQASRVSMAQWCKDVRAAARHRFSEGTGVRYKRIWRRYGGRSSDERPPWIEAIQDDTGVSLDDLRQDYGARPSVADAAPEVRREVFQQLAADPDVIEEAARPGTPTSRSVSDLQEQTHVIRERQRERMIESDPVGRSLERMRGSEGVDAVCIRFFREARQFAADLRAASVDAGPVGAQQKVFIGELVTYLRSLADHLERMTDGEQTDIDAFLGDVLGGGRHGSRP